MRAPRRTAPLLCVFFVFFPFFPCRHFLDAQHVRVVDRREPQHLVEERAALRWLGVAVEEVPAADEHATTLLRCASCSPTPRRSLRGTTINSRQGSRVRVPTSSS